MFISFWVTALRHSAKISPRGERSFALPEKYQVVKAYNTRTSEVCRVVSENDFTSQSSIAGIIDVDSSCNRRGRTCNQTPGMKRHGLLKTTVDGLNSFQNVIVMQRLQIFYGDVTFLWSIGDVRENVESAENLVHASSPGIAGKVSSNSPLPPR